MQVAVLAALLCVTSTQCMWAEDRQLAAQEMRSGKATMTQDIQYACEAYVSLEGKADAQGTKEDPFATVEQARDFMRKQSLDETNRGIVYIREGVYQVTKETPTIELTGEDSYVTYAAYEGEEVVFSGTATLSKDGFHKLHEVTGEQYSSSVRLQEEMRDKVYVYDLGAEGIPTGSILKNGFNWPKQTFAPELMVDGELQTLAQYPNGTKTLSMTQILAGKTKNGQNEDEEAKAAGANEGERPRNYWFDKTDQPKTYEEMLLLKGPVFYTRNGLEEQIADWAPPTMENEPQDNQPQVHAGTDHTKYETDGWLSGYFENNYANDMCRIYSVDMKTQTIHCKYPSLQGVQDKRIQLTAVNLLCELDEEGEYYIDRYDSHDVLYFYPKGGEIKNQQIALTSSDAPFWILDDAEGVVITGITMTGTTGNGMEMRNCEACMIENCEFSNISMDAIKIGENNLAVTADPSYETSKGGHNNLVRSCLIHDIGCGGVYTAGGNEQTLERGNNVVEHCEIYNISRLQTYTPAVYLEGVGNTARYNYIHDAPHMVIQIMGNDMLVTHNHIDHACTNTSDQAPIYSGRCFTWLGNEISYNLVENVKSGCYAIYMDDFMSGMQIHHNIFKNVNSAAIFSNNGFGHQITDNVFINVKETVKYAAYSKTTRPIDNEKVLQYRYYRMFREGDGSNYTNTKQQIESIYQHYEKAYPFLRGKYLPEEADEGWNTDEQSVFVASDQILKRSIVVGGATANTSAVEEWQNKYFDTENYQTDSLDKLGLELSNGKFHTDSPLTGEEAYGSSWILAWNEQFAMDEIGIVQRELLKGDVNLDGRVTLTDAYMALKLVLGVWEADSYKQQCADVDGQAGVTMKDVSVILRRVLGMEKLS